MGTRRACPNQSARATGRRADRVTFACAFNTGAWHRSGVGCADADPAPTNGFGTPCAEAVALPRAFRDGAWHRFDGRADMSAQATASHNPAGAWQDMAGMRPAARALALD